MAIVLAKLLLLVFVANGAPILARWLMAGRLAYPVDAGYRFIDARPLLGQAKTWRGIFASVLATVLLAILLELGWVAGLLVACGAMAGDLLSSFIKRRCALPASAKAPLLDQIPESLLPLLLVAPAFALRAADIILLVILFFVFELLLSKILYRIGIRQQPY